MLATVGSYGLSFAAGTLSTLSPCVLPLVPILIGSAAASHRLGPLALATGLTISFTAIGIFVSTLGGALGIDQQVVRVIGAALLIFLGIILLSSSLQQRFAVATSGVSGAGQNLLAKISPNGLQGQFMLGLLLGIVWSPCVGPTLGAAVTLASQGTNLAHTSTVMLLFGLGAGIPLVLIGVLSRQALSKFRGRLMAFGQAGKKILGTMLAGIGLLVIFGADKAAEGWILDLTPEWLVNLTTSI